MATEREERQMRILKIASGVAVLVITLGFERHLLRHMFDEVSHNAKPGLAAFAGITAILAVGALSFIGGCLLLVRDR
jgi:nitrate reductase gamma subunit